MSNVVEIGAGSEVLREREEVPVAGVLNGALDAGLTSVVVVGRDAGGELFVAASRGGDQSLALLARATAWLACGNDRGLIAEGDGAV